MDYCMITPSEKRELLALLAAYNDGLDKLKEFVLVLQKEWKAEHNSQSEEWRETDAGRQGNDNIEMLGDWIIALEDPWLEVEFLEPYLGEEDE